VAVLPLAGPIAAHQLVAAASILLLGAINYVGVRSGSGTNALLTVAKVTGLLLLVGFAVASPRVTPVWTPLVPEQVASPLGAFGVAVIAVLWAAEGYYFLTYAAGEVRDPARTLPRALTVGLSAIALIYLAANLAYLYALPMEELRGTTRVAERAAAALVGPTGAAVVTTSVLVSTLGADAAVLLAGSRLLFAMAEGGLFFARAAAVHPRFRTPHVAVTLLTVWSALLALTGTYEQLFTYVVFTSVIFSLLGGLPPVREPAVSCLGLSGGAGGVRRQRARARGQHRARAAARIVRRARPARPRAARVFLLEEAALTRRGERPYFAANERAKGAKMS